ncbi:MAG: lipoyl(octanoyl) transferase LipB [Zoogloeaceae bacterium]|jgi:lipoyl(octanoyl) transferase|nr:lipoyl(octanoyl) transferase LipB [Zoogloeaceae bacterium]
MDIHIRRLGLSDYLTTWEAMRAFTRNRTPDTPDEFWLTEHPPVFTLGQSGKPEHILKDIGIPVVKSDRGGQVTYHGPGQLIIYLLVDLRRRRLKVGEMVRKIEVAIINSLCHEGLTVNRRAGAPGVYMGERGEGAKIAALGLRVSQGASYHGLSLNVAMDLSPFAAINPCGYPGLAVTQTRDEGLSLTVEAAGELLSQALLAEFSKNLPAEPKP